MIDARLFGRRPWYADSETCNAINRKLDDIGLQERVPGDNNTRTSTSLGGELNLDLVMVFIGLWFEWDMLWILEEHGLIDEIEGDLISEKLEAGHDPERVILPFVRRAYFDFYNPSRLLN